MVVAPSGEQYEIAGGGYRAIVTECGAGLRVLEYDGAPLVQGYDEAAMASGGRGQLLLPWPNRIQDGAYSFHGRELQLAISEPALHNASHGLTRWTSWTVEETTAHSVALMYRLMAQSGYPWTLDLQVQYDLSATGLTVTVTVSNLSEEAAPYAQGAHPYLTVGTGPVDGWELLLPAATRVLTDERLLPSGTEPVEDTRYDFRLARPIKDLQLDDAFTDLVRDASGRAQVELHDPATGRRVALWMDAAHGWIQAFTGDTLPVGARAALAVEPMTAPANAFRSGDGLITLGPAGAPDDTHSSSWGITAL
ncbi:MAG: aldose 1-epimerase family protein [Nocardioidaceae bacterium]